MAEGRDRISPQSSAERGGGIIAEEWRIETVADRVETTGLTWLGLTFNCCRCHDHKYDPITQREFYSFSPFSTTLKRVGRCKGNLVIPIP